MPGTIAAAVSTTIPCPITGSVTGSITAISSLAITVTTSTKVPLGRVVFVALVLFFDITQKILAELFSFFNIFRVGTTLYASVIDEQHHGGTFLNIRNM